MAVRFQHRISLLPGVKINFSLSGVSATIGPRGASVTVGDKGATLNLGVPGTGISWRTPLGLPSERAKHPRLPESPPSSGSGELQPIVSRGVDELTSDGLSDLRDFIAQAWTERGAIEQRLKRVSSNSSLARSTLREEEAARDNLEQRLARLRTSWFRSFRRTRIAATEVALAQAGRKTQAAKDELHQIELEEETLHDACENHFFQCDFALSSAAQTAWQAVASSFQRMGRAQRVWDVTADVGKQRGAERSVATRKVERRLVTLELGELSIIQSDYEALHWQNANGNDIFLYPGFVIVFQDAKTFAMLDLRDIEIEFRPCRFEEREPVPSDAKVVGQTWTYANRDGSPDRRFNNNAAIPVALYAEILWFGRTGLTEAFMISDFDATAAFERDVVNFRKITFQEASGSS